MPTDKFSYQNLRVYEDMIQFISVAEGETSVWDSVHAITDHLYRASEGALVSLAEASRTRRSASRNEALAHSLGSILECSGCFDIAACKSLCSSERTDEMKQKLGSIFKQLIALKNSWKNKEIREETPAYGNNHVFNHEQLEAYKLGLELNRNIASFRFLDRLTRSEFRRIDEPATSIVLNIAEGNGRLAHLDHSRFLEIANRSNTKLAARLEISVLRGVVQKDEATELHRLLVRIDQMTARLADTWAKGGK